LVIHALPLGANYRLLFFAPDDSSPLYLFSLVSHDVAPQDMHSVSDIHRSLCDRALHGLYRHLTIFKRLSGPAYALHALRRGWRPTHYASAC